MSMGLSNVMAAMRAPLRLLDYHTPTSAGTPAPAPTPTAPTPQASPSVTPSSIQPPRLVSYQSPVDPQAALEAVRLDAQSFMTDFMKTFNQAKKALLPTLTSLRDQIAKLLEQPVAAPTPAPAPAPAPAKPKPKPKPGAAPKPTTPAGAKDFKAMLGISNERLASVLGISADSARRNLPMIAQAIQEAGIKSKNAIIAILATIKVEVGNYDPINEYGGPKYWARYNGRTSLGNRPGTNDGVTYHGRGYIQLTGRYNYTTYGKKLGVDLVNHPDKALDPKIASKVLVQYFKDRGLIAKADRGDWKGVRLGVNGGLNGWPAFSSMVTKLKNAIK